ncbi:hypothetical protein WJ542_04085 [Paraburkholderia sp. B3]|uniref:hypothetical protein n=1 Tax=Paraburkholderia sp. B3 TaxID=3134791 RepID=UPI003981B073
MTKKTAAKEVTKIEAASATKPRVALSVRIKGQRSRAALYAGIDAAVRDLKIESGPSVLKRIRMAVKHGDTVEAEFNGKTFVFSAATI